MKSFNRQYSITTFIFCIATFRLSWALRFWRNSVLALCMHSVHVASHQSALQSHLCTMPSTRYLSFIFCAYLSHSVVLFLFIIIALSVLSWSRSRRLSRQFWSNVVARRQLPLPSKNCNWAVQYTSGQKKNNALCRLLHWLFYIASSLNDLSALHLIDLGCYNMSFLLSVAFFESCSC